MGRWGREREREEKESQSVSGEGEVRGHCVQEQAGLVLDCPVMCFLLSVKWQLSVVDGA